MSTEGRSTRSRKHWWRGAVVLRAGIPLCDALDLLEHAPGGAAWPLPALNQSVEWDGLWLYPTPEDYAQPTRTVGLRKFCRNQAASVQGATTANRPTGPWRVLLDVPQDGPALPLALDATALATAPSTPLLAPDAGATALHAQLTCTLRSTPLRWPFWTLPAAVALERTDFCALQVLLTLLLSIRGTVAIDAHAVEQLALLHRHSLHHGDDGRFTLLDATQQLTRWRKLHPALQYGSMRLLPPHPQLLSFVREYRGRRILCVFNLSDRYVRERLPTGCGVAYLLAGSGLGGARVLEQTIDCDPWGGLFALLHS